MVSRGSSGDGTLAAPPGRALPHTGCQHPPVLVPPQCCQASGQGLVPGGSPALRRVGEPAATGLLASGPDGRGQQELRLLPLQPLPPFLGARGLGTPLHPDHPAPALPAQRQPAAPHWLPCLPGGLLGKGQARVAWAQWAHRPSWLVSWELASGFPRAVFGGVSPGGPRPLTLAQNICPEVSSPQSVPPPRLLDLETVQGCGRRPSPTMHLAPASSQRPYPLVPQGVDAHPGATPSHRLPLPYH